MLGMKKKGKIIGVSIITMVLVMTVCGLWIHKRIERSMAIQKAIANPKYIDPKEILNEIDDSFQKLSEDEKKKIIDNPVVTENRIA